MLNNKTKSRANMTSPRSADKNHFASIPRIVSAMSRSSYDFIFYSVVRDICGEVEGGECWLGSEKLAELCKMSVGKVDDCRAYWIRMGFLNGNKIRHGDQLVWHLKIVDIWSRNNEWVKQHPTIESRVEYAKSLKAQHKRGYDKKEKSCTRCKKTFTATGRRHSYCSRCAEERHHEQLFAAKSIRMRKEEYIQSSVCEKCGGYDDLELHLDGQAEAPAVICKKCHDDLHYNIHPMNVVDFGRVLSSHESTRSSGKLSEKNLSPDERKNNQVLKEKPSLKVGRDLKGEDLWNAALPIFKKRLSTKDFERYFGPTPTYLTPRQYGNELSITIMGEDEYQEFWSTPRIHKIILSVLQGFDPDIELDIGLISL